MNAEKIVSLKGGIVSKTVVLANPEKYKDQPMLCFLLKEEYIPEIRRFLQEKVDFGDLELELKPWPKDPSKQAIHFYYMVRDRVAKAQGDESRSNKDSLSKHCIESFKFMYHGHPKGSMTNLSKRELWCVTEKMYEWASEAGCMMKDLEAEWKGLSAELVEEIRNDDVC